jgi:hypothetical protein
MAGRGRSVLRDRSVHALRNSIIDGSRIKTLAEATRSSEVTPTTKQAGEATVREERRTGQAISHGVLLAVCCLLSYKIITVLLTVSRFVPRQRSWRRLPTCLQGARLSSDTAVKKACVQLYRGPRQRC